MILCICSYVTLEVVLTQFMINEVSQIRNKTHRILRVESLFKSSWEVLRCFPQAMSDACFGDMTLGFLSKKLVTQGFSESKCQTCGPKAS